MSQEVSAAARRCYLRLGVEKTTMADIAAEAGISRATLYRRFANRDAVFLDVLQLESSEMAADATAVLSEIEEPGERVVEGILFCIREVPKRPLHSHFFRGEAAAWSAKHTLHSNALQRIARGFLEPMLGRELEKFDAGKTRLDDLAEWVMRILVSYVTVPSARCDDATSMRRILRAMLLPAVQAIVIQNHGENSC